MARGTLDGELRFGPLCSTGEATRISMTKRAYSPPLVRFTFPLILNAMWEHRFVFSTTAAQHFNQLHQNLRHVDPRQTRFRSLSGLPNSRMHVNRFHIMPVAQFQDMLRAACAPWIGDRDGSICRLLFGVFGGEQEA